MRGLIAVVALLSVAAWAGGVKSKNMTGAAPTASTDGLSLAGVEACRVSIHVDGGGDIAAGCKLVPWYMDQTTGPVSAWTQGASAEVCTTEALLDGGIRDSYICPPLATPYQSGRMAVQKVVCVGRDGGSGAACTDPGDGGCVAGQQPVVNLSCYGANIIN